jgi:hypothetical protein
MIVTSDYICVSLGLTGGLSKQMTGWVNDWLHT